MPGRSKKLIAEEMWQHIKAYINDCFDVSPFEDFDEDDQDEIDSYIERYIESQLK